VGTYSSESEASASYATMKQDQDRCQAKRSRRTLSIYHGRFMRSLPDQHPKIDLHVGTGIGISPRVLVPWHTKPSRTPRDLIMICCQQHNITQQIYQ